MSLEGAGGGQEVVGVRLSRALGSGGDPGGPVT